jgi:hypothetical protein
MKLCLAFAVVVSLSLVACGDDGGGSGTTSPTPKESTSPTRTLGPTSTPRALAGIDLYDWDTWQFEGKSGCASQNPEGPFLGPSQFEVSAGDLPVITFPQAQLTEARLCRLADVTVLNYILVADVHIELVAGPPEWPVYAPLDSVRTEGDLVIAPEATEFAGLGATVIRQAPFGLIVGYGASEADLIAAVSAIDPATIQMPEAKDIFTGDVNGIHFESEFSDADKRCKFSSFGFVGTEPTTAPADQRVIIEPSYLPEHATAHQSVLYSRCDDIESAEVSYYIDEPAADPNDQYYIVRKSGVPEWTSLSSAGWYSETTVAGLPAVLLAPPAAIAGEVAPGATLFIREDFGLTVVDGPDQAEVIQIAGGLNRKRAYNSPGGG